MPTVNVLDSTIAYREEGSGAPMVFLHGNPASAYVWRTVLPAIGSPARLLAPDLIGMGESGKPDIDYTFDDHSRYLDAWFDALDLGPVVLVGHDWGGALALDWATRHPDRVRGIALSEAVLKPLIWAEFAEPARELFQELRTPGVGEVMALDKNIFIEAMLPAGVNSGLSPADHDVYRSYYPTPESRKPLLQWARSQPLEGEPADVVRRITAFDEWAGRTPEIPKLLLTAEQTATTSTTPEMVEWSLANIAGLETDQLGPAGHEAPEDQPAAMAAAITDWAARHHLF